MGLMRTILPAIALTTLLAACVAAPGDGGATSSSSSAASSSLSSDYADMIQVSEPATGAEVSVSEPLVVRGEAVGPWYFEASFPVRLLDSNDNELAVTAAQAQGDWMTTDFVPFEAILNFSTTDTSGTLVLQNDNPSGEPQNAKSIEIPVTFVP